MSYVSPSSGHNNKALTLHSGMDLDQFQYSSMEEEEKEVNFSNVIKMPFFFLLRVGNATVLSFESFKMLQTTEFYMRKSVLLSGKRKLVISPNS